MQQPVVAVAASGGRDSTALLHATARAARAADVHVVALHIHHGLNPSADDWLRHVQQQCARWARAGLPLRFASCRLAGSPGKGESIEAWARRGRYEALAEMACEAGAGLILLAHHRRDQAETLLLQALRGAGPAGLAAMPREAERSGLTWARPWLDQPGEAIEAYVARHRLRHIEDDSNQDTRFDRNRLRHEVWPALLAAFPNAETALTQSARQSQLAAELVAEVAQADLAACGDGDALAVAAWLALSPARRWAAMRLWLAQQAGADAARSGLLARLADELPAAVSARWPLDAARELRLYRGRLSVAELDAPAAASPPEASPRLDEAGWLDLPGWGGRLELRAVEQGGIALPTLAQATLRARQPGDDFQFAPRSTARSLKKQYQAKAVPAWLRGGPVIASADHLLFVPSLGVDARGAAPPGEPQSLPVWWPTQPA